MSYTPTLASANTHTHSDRHRQFCSGSVTKSGDVAGLVTPIRERVTVGEMGTKETHCFRDDAFESHIHFEMLHTSLYSKSGLLTQHVETRKRDAHEMGPWLQRKHWTPPV